MKITAIDTVLVFVPWKDTYKEPMRKWRAYWNKTTVEKEDAYVLIRMHTDEGIVGIGEGGRSIDAVRKQADRMIGKNPLELDPWSLPRPFVHAVFDIMGKALDVPVWRLLGGKHRDTIPVAYWSPYTTPARAAKFAEEGRGLGFRVHKIKARASDAVETIASMAKAAGPDYAIRVDPNETFEQPSVLVRIDDLVSDYNVECWEDPVPRNRLEWYELLRYKCNAALALTPREPRLMFAALRHDAADYYNVSGPALEAVKLSAIAEAGGCPVWLQWEGHCLDINAAFLCHLGAAIPNASRPYDVLPFLREGSIVTNPPEVKNGRMQVPQGPGLGVQLDEKAVRHYHVA